MNPPDVITAHQIHRIYCSCGGMNMSDVAAATAWKEDRGQVNRRTRGAHNADTVGSTPTPATK